MLLSGVVSGAPPPLFFVFVPFPVQLPGSVWILGGPAAVAVASGCPRECARLGLLLICLGIHFALHWLRCKMWLGGAVAFSGSLLWEKRLVCVNHLGAVGHRACCQFGSPACSVCFSARRGVFPRGRLSFWGMSLLGAASFLSLLCCGVVSPTGFGTAPWGLGSNARWAR